MERLNSEIDALSETADHAEMVTALQKVLRTMAFYVSQSEAAVLEYREAWHDSYTDALYLDAGSREAQEQSASGVKRFQQRDRNQLATEAARPRTRVGTSAATLYSGAERAALQRAALQSAAVEKTAAARSRQASIPASLRAIMAGSHPSFRETDGF